MNLRVDALQEEKTKIEQMICEYKNSDVMLTSVEKEDLSDELSNNGPYVVKQTLSDMIDFIESQGKIGTYSNRCSRTKSDQSMKNLRENMQVYRLHQELKRIDTLILGLNSESKFTNSTSIV